MIKEFVDRWEARKAAIRAEFATHADTYKVVVERTVKHLRDLDETYTGPDPEHTCIHEIDDGDYQGTLLYLIPQRGYQPDRYFYVKVGYGSCSGCDTLEGIKSSGSYGDSPTEAQIDEYMTLALHVVQGLKEI